MKKLDFLIGKTIKRVHFARGEAGYLMSLDLSFTDGTNATLMIDAPKLPIKCLQMGAEDESIPVEIKL